MVYKIIQYRGKLNSFATISKRLAKTSDVNCQDSGAFQSDVSCMFNADDITVSRDTNDISFGTAILKALQSQRPSGAFNFHALLINIAQIAVSQLKKSFWNSRRELVRT